MALEYLLKLSIIVLNSVDDVGRKMFGELLSSLDSVDHDVAELERKFEQTQAFLSGIDRCFIDDKSFNVWLENLKDVVDLADDQLCSFRTFDAISKIKFKKRKRDQWWYDSFISIFFSWRQMLENRRTRAGIAEIIAKLETIHAETRDYRSILKVARMRRPTLSVDDQTTSLPGESRFVGRQDDLFDIVSRLTENRVVVDGIQVVSICGMGGLGKTALAQQVFSHSGIIEHFRRRIWVSMREDSDAVRTTKEIIESIHKRKCDDLSFDVLQDLLLVLLNQCRFLLVLDDAWREDSSFWEAFMKPLVHAKSKGSKVLVTTRSTGVCSMMTKDAPILLQGLNFDAWWQLFRGRPIAPPGVINDDPNKFEIGKLICERCQGSPMAAKFLGRYLYEKTDEHEWRHVLDNILGGEERGGSISKILKVSYDRLELDMKQCFEYCSVFPVGHEFDKDDLIKMWMAEGLISSKGNIGSETVGDRYFRYLLQRSFFQVYDDSDQLNIKYKMPTLIHELAQSVCQHKSVRVGHNERKSGGKKVRYVFCSLNTANPEALGLICESKSVRTFILHFNRTSLSKGNLHCLLPSFQSLRVLDLRNEQLEQLPDFIGDLIHLRYLGLYNTQITHLPESVSRLHNLLILNLDECYKLVKLPKGLHELVNLRHLNLKIDWDRWTDLNSMPPGISDLKSLETMSRFSVSTENGCRISELEDLKLRGEVCISKLENVENIDDARDASLSTKFIERLMLRWSKDRNSNTLNVLNPRDVIECLRPHVMLKCLRIDNYPGEHLPQWLADRSFWNLESITLSNCSRCTILPAMSQLPNLKKLVLKDCVGLTSLPQLPTIHTLVVEGCDGSAFGMLSGLTTLSSLTISRCGDRQVKESSFQKLTSIKKLKIEKCSRLESVASNEDLRILTCLESLEISSCKELVHFADRGLPASLSYLQLHDCENLVKFPINLRLLAPGLQRLVLSRCNKLRDQLQRDGDNLAHIPERNREIS